MMQNTVRNAQLVCKRMVKIEEYALELVYSLHIRVCDDPQLCADHEYDVLIEKEQRGERECAVLWSVSSIYDEALRMFDTAHRCRVTPMCALEFAEEYFASHM